MRLRHAVRGERARHTTLPPSLRRPHARGDPLTCPQRLMRCQIVDHVHFVKNLRHMRSPHVVRHESDFFSNSSKLGFHLRQRMHHGHQHQLPRNRYPEVVHRLDDVSKLHQDAHSSRWSGQAIRANQQLVLTPHAACVSFFVANDICSCDPGHQTRVTTRGTPAIRTMHARRSPRRHHHQCCEGATASASRR